MQKFIIKRLLLAIPMLFGITFLSFSIMQMAPGESGKGGSDGSRSKNITAEQRKIMNRTFHLDQPVYTRYFYWIGVLQNVPTEEERAAAERRAVKKKLFGDPNSEQEPTSEDFVTSKATDGEINAQIEKTGLIHGDFGYSMSIHSKKAWDMLAEAIPITLMFNVIAFILIYLFAIPIGVYSATHQNSKTDKTIAVILFLLYSMPSFWVAALLCRLVVSLPQSMQVPIQGIQPDNARELPTIEWPMSSAKYMILPIICMTYASFAGLSRYMRTSMINTIRDDYVRTARAKGLKEFVVIYKHALRNSLIPIITILGSELPMLIGGSVIIETIFGIPGLGRVGYYAILQRDYTVLMANLTIVAVLVMIGFVVSDILYKVADPRITFEGSSK